MKRKVFLSFIAIALMLSAFCQKTTINITFTATNNGAYVKLDSIKVMNRTQGGGTVIYWPDTTLSRQIAPGDLLLYIGYSTGFPVGFQEINREKKQFLLCQNYPNPAKVQSVIPR
jgi:hypothetical protein